jgi:hypothetical protein
MIILETPTEDGEINTKMDQIQHAKLWNAYDQVMSSVNLRVQQKAVENFLTSRVIKF